MQTCCSKKTVDDRKGCVSKPLLEFEPEFIIVDELHMLLRISDRLINSLMLRMAQFDNAEHAMGSHCHGSHGESEVKLQFYLGGDYKVQLLHLISSGSLLTQLLLVVSTALNETQCRSLELFMSVVQDSLR